MCVTGRKSNLKIFLIFIMELEKRRLIESYRKNHDCSYGEAKKVVLDQLNKIFQLIDIDGLDESFNKFEELFGTGWGWDFYIDLL